MKSNKSNTKKRVLAIVLCMVLMLSSGISTMADGEVAAGTPTPESAASQEPAAASVEGETVEGEHTPAEKSTETQEETPTESSAAESKDEPAADSNTLSGVTELVGGSGTQDNVPEQGTETDLTEQESEIVSEATELKQEFTDEAGNVTQRVTANIPEGAFKANASEITMEVNYLDEAAENHVKELMTAALPENEILGDYILYDIKFKVNGEVTEPQKAITITFEGSGLHIEDTKKANTFYIDPADPEVQDDKDEMVEITQKSEMIEMLQNAGQSVEAIDEYDLSEIFVNADGTADKILMEGRISTVYGCYLEKTPVQVLEYTDGDVAINVNAYTEDAIPAGASLKVVPLQSDNEETEEQYKEVEEQLNKKAETEEYDVAGFLAYDISFINEDGEEVEPNGDVKVTINYKKEAIPDGVEDSSNLDVTVMHLEEDEAGDVKDVVDMVADTSKKAIVETTEGVKVTKAEFITDSFSTYTVTWTIAYSRYVKLTAYYGYENNGQFVGFTQNATTKIPNSIKTGDKVNLNNYANQNVFKSDVYAYDKAYYSISGYENKSAANYIKVQKSSSKYYLKKSINDDDYTNITEIKNNSTQTLNIYYVYKKTDKLTEVETVDHIMSGITMRMIDMEGDTKDNYKIWTNANKKINLGGGYENGSIKKGLLESVLGEAQPGSTDRYPITTGTNTCINGSASKGTKGQNLATLFAGGTTVNHLFRKDIYDSTGYFEYSSFENYAYLGNSSNFTVYNQIGTPDNANEYFYQRGNFMPYNKIENGKFSTNTNLYDENGKLLGSNSERRGEKLYKTQGTNNYQFGMFMAANFIQPKGGIVDKTQKSMRYEFNGDDDLWVYIDNVLVLDIGGVHDAHSGYIDFATGEVGIYDSITKNYSSPILSTTNIKDLFRNAGMFPDGKKWDDKNVNEYFQGNTFKDFTSHSFKMFYMERGKGASNLHMKFNLEVIPEGQVEVTKRLTNTDKENYTNVNFAFQVFAQKIINTDEQGNEIYSEDIKDYVPLDKAVYKNTEVPVVFENAVFEVDGKPKTYENVFYLKPDQTAQFKNLKQNRKYYVVEVGVKASEYDKIIINGTEYKAYNDKEQITGIIEDIKTNEQEVSARPVVICENNCSLYNSRELRITKKMKSGQVTDDTFSFKIQLTNQDNQLVDYANGNYYLKDQEGYYYFYNDSGELVRNESTADSDKPAIVCGKSDSSGVITDIPVDYTVVISKILSGTSFQIQEVDLDTSQYFSPEKYVYPESCDQSEVKDADGMISLGKDAEVDITNSKRTNTIIIKKVDSQNQAIVLEGATFEIQKWDGSQFIPVQKDGKPWEQTTDKDGIVTFSDLEKGKYKVIESAAPEGYILNAQNDSFEVDLPYVKEVPENTTITVDETSLLEDGSYCIITKAMTNQKREWEILKRSSSSEKLFLPNAEFELSPVKTGGSTYYGKSQEDGKLNWYKNKSYIEAEKISESEILPATYILKEISAPAGYILSTETWTITIGQYGSWVSAEGIGKENIVERNNKIICYFENTAVYELPSAGGSGIYRYSIGGMLLMMAAALILYKNKRREVLKS